MPNVIRGGAGWQELGLDFRRPRSASESAPHFEAFTNKVFARCKFCQPNQKTWNPSWWAQASRARRFLASRRKQERLPSVLEEDRASGLSPCPTALITVATTVTALARQW